MLELDPRPPCGGRFINITNCCNVSIRALIMGRYRKRTLKAPNGQLLRSHRYFIAANVSLFYKLFFTATSSGLKQNAFQEQYTLGTRSIDEPEDQTSLSVVGKQRLVFRRLRQSTIHQKWNVDMTRKRNTTKTGGSFTDATIEAVWNKATPISGRPGYAKDQCGATIYRHSYGTTTELGWEIDHRDPVSNGGSDDLSNLQPLHWQNNRGKGDQYPSWSCTVRN